jgi:hypothetical protein
LQTWWGGQRLDDYAGAYIAFTGAYLIHEDKNICRATFQTTMLFANLSALPDAVLDMRCWALSREGTWLPLILPRQSYDSRQTQYPGFPLDLPPRQLVNLRVTFAVDVPSDRSDDFCATCFAQPLRLKVELIGLGERCHRSEVVVDPAEKGG